MLDSLYYKPHLGPEETDMTLMKNDQLREVKRNINYRNYSNRINRNRAARATSNAMERKCDLQNLDVCAATIKFENIAMEIRKKEEKKKLKEAWDQ